MTPELIFIILRTASTIYVSVLVSFALLVGLTPLLVGRTPLGVLNAYRAFGPVLGVSMGVWVFSALGSHYLGHAGLSWSWDTWPARLQTLQWVAFLLLWASSFVLEIWTLEPLRQADQNQDAPTGRAIQKVRNHLVLNAALASCIVLWDSLP